MTRMLYVSMFLGLMLVFGLSAQPAATGNKVIHISCDGLAPEPDVSPGRVGVRNKVDTVQWNVSASIALCGGTQARISWVANQPPSPMLPETIPAAMSGVKHNVRGQIGNYKYKVQILDMNGNVVATVDPRLHMRASLPGLTTWGLMMLGGLLVAAGAFFVHRRLGT